jgi:hypothetical protein
MTLEFAPRVSKKDTREAEKLGGSDTADYRSNYPTYPDKGGHKQRSIVNQPSHEKHWKKGN